jgi:hypothetical protein
MITPSEVDQHLAHGDALGECPLDCKGIPFGKAIIDQCGVCGGDNSTCKDCSGVPNGTKTIDVCGVCGGDGSTCWGCDGIPNSGKVIDVCGKCGGDNSTCKDCAGMPNGGKTIDQCGVCGGNNTTCFDCAGKVNGTAKTDACGVCGGNSLSCLNGEGCMGAFDLCGVCNGSNACLDCAGIPNGGTAIDCCGVCGGDGSTCIDKCKFYDLRSAKKKASANFKKLYASVRKYSNQERICAPGKAVKAKTRLGYAKKILDQSTSYLSTLISDTIKVCDTIFCQKTSLSSVLTTIQTNTKKLYQLSRQSQYAAGSACGRVNKGKTRRDAQGNFTEAVSSLKKFPSVRCDN